MKLGLTTTSRIVPPVAPITTRTVARSDDQSSVDVAASPLRTSPSIVLVGPMLPSPMDVIAEADEPPSARESVAIAHAPQSAVRRKKTKKKSAPAKKPATAARSTRARRTKSTRRR